MEHFEPEIVAFCCHYCAYTAADMAGSKRISYPSNVKIIRVPCSGKVDAIHLMKALEKGADGVYVAGCLAGDCHFKNGNVRAEARVNRVKKLLTELGWEPERVAMFNMSAGMGEAFAQVAKEFTETIKKLGPSPGRTGAMDKAAS
ncbi:MAG: hydrogenase iron-sulfur subunit [Desulfotignum sp.]|jgi:coenzyme F420-reducing hydrogenase delta subunit|nr:hydrogenase iron-sulfur subunit [Desulfotignum sp.]MCF8089483.1 hydrogenase iron-sulfur subunit [Desulfotignum sp.]MCF8135767.1 hydrogenase iron-sulfur subunit [Desulfotignum sp.]